MVYEGATRLLAPLEASLAEGEVHGGEEDEETVDLPHAKAPVLPSAEEVEKHRVHHTPFRSWCQQCVEGRGVGHPHRVTGSESSVPVVGMDYFFITKEGVKRRDELASVLGEEGEIDNEIAAARAAGKLIKCFLVRCMSSKHVFAHVVLQKCDDEDHFCAKLVVEDIKWMGHTKVVIKTDNERAIVSLKTRVARLLREFEGLQNVQTESPPAHDSQSNGGVEIGIRLVRGLFRTLKLCLEARIGTYIPVSHALTPWLLEHTCTLLNALSKGPDGQTPWERTKGRPMRQLLLGFAECILCKLPAKGPRNNPDGNMGTRWIDGTLLGISRSANTYIVATDGGVFTCRTIYRKPIENRWIRDRILRLKATPWAMTSRADTEAKPREGSAVPAQPTEKDITPVPKALRILHSDMVEHGFTEGCAQCLHNEMYGKSRDGMSHTPKCRQRFLEKLMETPHGRIRLEAYEGRVDQALEDRKNIPTTSASTNTRETSAPGGASSSSGLPGRAGGSEVTTGPAGAPTTTETAMESSEKPTEATPDDHDDSNGQDMDAEFWDSNDTDMEFMGNLNPESDDDISAVMIEQLGIVDHRRRNNSKRYRTEGMPSERAVGLPKEWRPQKYRESQKFLVSEIYSPPRITAEVRRGKYKHLSPGIAFDLTVNDPDDGRPWDFSRHDKREKARKILRSSKPFLLIGSPMCTAFSTWQRLNYAKSNDKPAMQRAFKDASAHVEFVTELYREQLEGRRYFLHEHPRYATSWNLACMESLGKAPGVARVDADQCQFGAVASRGPNAGQPLKKPIGFMSNAPEVLKNLDRRCEGRGGECSCPSGGRHAPCTGSVCRDAARYPRGLCQAVLSGLTAQLRSDGRIEQGCHGV